MPKHRKRPEKAYKNLDFLNSHEARPVRILAELFEPFRRFRQQDVRDTVVFLGYARIQTMAEAPVPDASATATPQAEMKGPHGPTVL